MKKLALVLIAVSGLVSGCIGYVEPHGNPGVYQGSRDRDRDGIPNRADRDRDGDGIPNRQDRLPDNPRRY